MIQNCFENGYSIDSKPASIQYAIIRHTGAPLAPKFRNFSHECTNND